MCPPTRRPASPGGRVWKPPNVLRRLMIVFPSPDEGRSLLSSAAPSCLTTHGLRTRGRSASESSSRTRRLELPLHTRPRAVAASGRCAHALPQLTRSRRVSSQGASAAGHTATILSEFDVQTHVTRFGGAFHLPFGWYLEMSPHEDVVPCAVGTRRWRSEAGRSPCDAIVGSESRHQTGPSEHLIGSSRRASPSTCRCSALAI